MRKSTKNEYGELLTTLIKKKNMTQCDFYNELGIKKAYFYDILGGKTNPPPLEGQVKIIEILKPNDSDKYKLLDIAAKLRNELPADILLYLRTNTNYITNIRKSENYKRIMEVK